LSRQPGLAQLVCALEEEAGAPAAQVQAGPHPVARLGRRNDVDRPLDRNPADPAKGIPYHLALEPALLSVRDVRKDRTAAPRVTLHGSPRRVRLDDFDDAPECQRPLGALDAHAHRLARDGAGHEHHHSLVTGQHAPAGRGFLGHERDEIVRSDHGGSITPR